jgi:tyrosinase
MTTFTRRNAWLQGGTFDNPDLFWYAKGVQVMQARALDDPNGWWFFAAIHGEEIGLTEFPGWGFIAAPPQVPTTPLPSQAMQDQYWNQCQHQSWFFAPWHRGYLVALEAQIRTVVVSLGGPEDWALPYWNYFGPDGESRIPPALASPTMPDGSPNPLFVTMRFGPKYNGDIYVEIPPASQACLGNTVYTGRDTGTKPPGFGGPSTGFSHDGNISGNLESNPHNLVHVDVGGIFPDETTYGLMSDPALAALDPIFYLHHANIDRMWGIWNAQGNTNPVDPNWLAGPAVLGQREFVMPMPGGVPWVYVPADVSSLSQMDYTYDDLTMPAVVQEPSSLTMSGRLTLLGSDPMADGPARGEITDQQAGELLGANQGVLQISGSGAHTAVQLDSGVRSLLSRSLAGASLEALPDRVFLQLEHVRGSIDACKLNVSVNQQSVGTVALFGLRRASQQDSAHGGAGLTFIFEITDIVDRLFLDGGLVNDRLDVQIQPGHPAQVAAPLTVGRISVYRQPQQ